MSNFQIKRGTTALVDAYHGSPVDGEPVFDTETNSLYIGGNKIGDGTLNAAGDWTGNHVKDDLVRQDGWTGYALVDTTTDLAPVAVGGLVSALDPATAFATSTYTGVVKMVHVYTMTQQGQMQNLQIKIPNPTADTLVRATVSHSDGRSKIWNIFPNNGWTTVETGGLTVLIGDVVTIVLEVYNSDSKDEIKSIWANDQTGSAPLNGYFDTDNINNPTRIWMDYQDYQNDDFQTVLDSVIVGSIMYLHDNSSPERSITLNIAGVDISPAGYVNYTTSVLSTGTDPFKNDRWISVSITQPITAPTEYFKVATPPVPAFANFSSELYLDAVLQANTTDAYGINMVFQQQTVSPDWYRLTASTTTPSAPPQPVGDHPLYGDEHTDVDNSVPLEARQGLYRKEFSSDLEPDHRAKFVPYFANKTYYPQETVYVDGYLSSANTITDDYPVPQPLGKKVIQYTGTSPEVTVTAKSIVFGARYTSQHDLIIDQYRVYGVTGYHYTIYSVADPAGAKLVEQIIDFTATASEWKALQFHNRIVPAGEVFDLVVVVGEPDPTPITWVGNWNYTTPRNLTDPLAGAVTHANKAVGFIQVSKTDNDGGDRGAELLALTAGDLLYTIDVHWTINTIQDNGTFVTFGVAPAIQSGADELKEFSFDTVTATPIVMMKDVGYWTTFSGIQGFYSDSGGYDTITLDQNAYGVDVRLQNVNQSTQWDIVGVASEGGVVGGSSEIVGLPLMQDTPPIIADYPDNTFWTRTTDFVLFQLYNNGGDRQWVQPVFDGFVPNTFAGAGTSGYVPDPVDQTGKVLLDDGSWAAPASGGGGGLAPYVDSLSKPVLKESITTTVIIRGGNFDPSTTVAATGGVIVGAITVTSDDWLEVEVTTPAGFTSTTLTLDNGGLASFGNALTIDVISTNLNFEFEVATTVVNSTMVLPLVTGFNYNMIVDWGDGSSDTITDWNQAEKTHIYAKIGVHKVSISGLCEAWGKVATGDKFITRVTNLGHMGWKNLDSAFSGLDNLVYFNAGDCDTSLNTSLEDFFYLSTKVADVRVSTMDVSNVISFFRTFNSVVCLVIDVLSWNTASAQTMDSMFAVTGKTSIIRSENLDLTNVTNIQRMYNSSGVLNLDFSSWVAPNLTLANNFLISCADLQTVTFSSGMNLSQVLDLSSFFSTCSSLLEIDVSMLDTSGCQNFGYFFSNCNNVRTITLGGSFSTASATSMTRMFAYLYHIESYPTAQLDTTFVTDMSYMFYFNENSKSIPIAGLVGAAATNVASMFSACYNMEAFDGSTWNMVAVINTSGLFQLCYRLATANFTGWNTPALEQMFQMFQYCRELTTLDLTTLEVSNVLNLSSSFEYCPNLLTVDTTGWNTASMTSMSYICRDSTLLDMPIAHFDIKVCKTFSYAMLGSAFSQTNYDPTLIAWAAQSPLSINEIISFGTAQYSPSNQSNRDILDFEPNNWTITDGGVGPEELLPPPAIPGAASTPWTNVGAGTTTGEGTLEPNAGDSWLMGATYPALAADQDGELFFKFTATLAYIGFDAVDAISNSPDFGMGTPDSVSTDVDIQEGASLITTTPFSTLVEYSIKRVGGVITYYVDGVLTYTSLTNFTAALYIDVSLSQGGVSNVRVEYLS